MTAAEVNDGEPAMNQAESGVNPKTLGIRPAMGNGIAHRLEDPRLDRATPLGI
jgi:hypothetical protein